MKCTLTRKCSRREKRAADLSVIRKGRRVGIDLSELYKRFEKYPLKPKIEGCPCCGLDNDEIGLHTSTLESLSWDELDTFIFKAMTTYGDVDDFKHFLPRIFELFVTSFEDAPYDVGVVFSKLEYGKWSEWPEYEKAEVKRTIDCWLADLKGQGTEEADEIYTEILGDMEHYQFTYHA